MQFDTTGSWVPVALSSDLPVLTVMPARVANATVALWRSASGRATASADRCPHRGMRLSHGFVRGEALSCIYHGWSYAQAGHCLKIPAHPGLTPPETIRVATYAITEQDGVLWAAAGTPAGEPPRLDGFSPLRSVTVDAAIGFIEAAAGAELDADGFLLPADAPDGLCLLLSDQGEGQTLVHVLVGQDVGPSARIAASRAVETLRRQAEALVAEGASA
jgi:nitrite reductase/ring-hydroxylating ferredoxin subunit